MIYLGVYSLRQEAGTFSKNPKSRPNTFTEKILTLDFKISAQNPEPQNITDPQNINQNRLTESDFPRKHDRK